MDDAQDRREHEELFKSMNAMEVPKIAYWASLGNLEQVRSALAENPDINIKDPDGLTALDLATENNHVEVMEFLRGNGGELGK